MLDKIALGTVQFGIAYGISNKIGMVPEEEVAGILEYAHRKGINTLDTAYSYGETEKIIGEFISKSGKNFNIISKLPDLNFSDKADIEKHFFETLKKLQQQKIYGYLVHKFGNILKDKALLSKLESLKKKKLIQKIGASLYKTEELQYLLDNNMPFDMLQIPYSIFDRRFENYLGLLKKNNVEVHVRSVFLQGLVFLKPGNLPANLIDAGEYITKLQNLASGHGISISSLCLNFALLNTYIDKVIIGVDSLAHLKKNIEDTCLIEKVRNMRGVLNDLHIKDEDIILPYKWGKA